MLLSTFLLENPYNDNHISSASPATKATLRFRNHCVNDVCRQADQHYTVKQFTCDREKGKGTTAATDSFVTFLIVDHYNVSICYVQVAGMYVF